MKMSKCGVHDGQVGEKIITRDSIESMEPSIYQWTLGEDKLPLTMSSYGALHVDKGHFPGE